MWRWLVSFGLLPALALALAGAGGARAATAGSPAADAVPSDTLRGSDGLLRVPALTRVWDPNGYLRAADRSAIEARLADFEARQGSQIAVLLVASTAPEPIEDFAHRVGDAWKIGRRGIGDGVLVVVAVRDRTARIDVARSLEGAIPDVTAFHIVKDRMGPRFAAGDYAGGVNAALDAIFSLINGEGLPPGPGANPHGGAQGEDTIRSMLPFLVGFVIAAMLLRRLLGVLGALIAAGGAAGIVGYVFSSLLLGGLAGIIVLVIALLGGPMMMLQVLGGRGGFGGGGFGGGGFRSGGGGDFSGGGASGNW